MRGISTEVFEEKISERERWFKIEGIRDKANKLRMASLSYISSSRVREEECKEKKEMANGLSL